MGFPLFSSEGGLPDSSLRGSMGTEGAGGSCPCNQHASNSAASILMLRTILA